MTSPQSTPVQTLTPVPADKNLLLGQPQPDVQDAAASCCGGGCCSS